MRVACLFSGGKDSALAALLLEPFCEVALVTGSFGVADHDHVAHARRAARGLGLPHARVGLDPAVARDSVEEMLADGYPRNGIQRVHEHALEVVAGSVASGCMRDLRSRSVAGLDSDGDALEWIGGDPGTGVFDAVADGTRRDDRVPTLSRADARSLEDRHGADYLRPLAGVGRSAVDALADAALEVETGPSETLPVGDYETELRRLLAAEHGAAAVEEIFPEHVQSRVVGRQ